MILDFRDREELHIIDPDYTPSLLDTISNPNNLHASFVNYKKSGVAWKQSVQQYEMNELRNNIRLHNEIESGKYKQLPPNNFILHERGKVRFITSDQVRDKIVQNSLNKYLLEPTLQPKLIYDNGASQKGKGISFTRQRFENHLRNAYREFSSNGYILLIDFSKYFDNILHFNLLNMIARYLNPQELQFVTNIVKEFEVDVSYMTDDEYESCTITLFNSLEHNTIDKSRLTGAKMMAKSIPIGSHTSQISGLFYPHEIDNYCKIVRSIKYYGRYMDDTYIIGRTKEELYEILHDIRQICYRLGIFINEKKTHIQPIDTWITFLKINYKLTETGGLIRKIPSEIIHRERRRLYKYKHLLDAGKINLLEIKNNYKSWRGTYSKYDSGYDIHKLDLEFMAIFKEPFNQ